MLSIGEFSQAARLTVKTLRYYHDLGILLPAKIDADSGYRYYDAQSLQRAAAISALKDLGFSLKEIQNILQQCSCEDDLTSFVSSKLAEVRQKKAELEELESRLKSFQLQSQRKIPDRTVGIIEEFDFELPSYVSLSVSGRYSDIGNGFRQLFKQYGRYICDSPYAFFHDMEYKDDDARMDAVVAVKLTAKRDANLCKALSGHAVKTVHKGPYGGQGAAYSRLFEYCHQHGYIPKPPIIEHYVKGPGMIFKGNPQNYVTECILLVE
ncbi:MAG: MerR family transcriptional regulator [Spirochaetales bacterium]|nr:MerR family transcriptional regulator [Spirochaetales bacterium]